MARQHGPLQLTGSIGNLSFYYHKEYGYLARQKGGARKGKLSPRTKENGHELGMASRTGKLIRRGIKAALHVKGDATVSQRLSGCLYRVLQHDKTSTRGERQVTKGLQTDEGRQLLQAFAFVKERPLEQVMHVAPVYSGDGTFELKGFVTERDFSWPAGATHVQLQGAVLFIDAPGNAYRYFPMETVVLQRDESVRNLIFQPEQAASGNGFSVAAVSVLFFQEVRGEWVLLEEGRRVQLVC